MIIKYATIIYSRPMTNKVDDHEGIQTPLFHMGSITNTTEEYFHLKSFKDAFAYEMAP